MSAKVYITKGKWEGWYHLQPIPEPCAKCGEVAAKVLVQPNGAGKRKCYSCVKSGMKRMYWRNPEKHRAKSRDWKQNNPDYQLEWQRRSTDILAKHRHARRAAASDGILYVKEDKCCVCGATGQLEVEHLHPISRGGTDYITNKVTMCWECNRGKDGKGTMSVADPEFLGWLLTRK